MGWDPDLVPRPAGGVDLSGFQVGLARTDVGEHAEMLALYRALAVLRRSRAELTDPRFDRNLVDFDDDEKWLLVNRSGLRIAVNFGRDRTIALGGPAGPMLLETQTGAEVRRQPAAASAHRRGAGPGRRMTPVPRADDLRLRGASGCLRSQQSHSGNLPPRDQDDRAAGAEPVAGSWLFGDQLGEHFLDSPDQRVLLIESRKVFARRRFHRQEGAPGVVGDAAPGRRTRRSVRLPEGLRFRRGHEDEQCRSATRRVMPQHKLNEAKKKKKNEKNVLLIMGSAATTRRFRRTLRARHTTARGRRSR